MISQVKIALKDHGSKSENVQLKTTHKTFFDLSALIDARKKNYLKITHQQINTIINLPIALPCVLLYFAKDENHENQLNFDGASYSLGTSGSFTICTESKHILTMPLPLKFKPEQIEKMILG